MSLDTFAFRFCDTSGNLTQGPTCKSWACALLMIGQLEGTTVDALVVNGEAYLLPKPMAAIAYRALHQARANAWLAAAPNLDEAFDQVAVAMKQMVRADGAARPPKAESLHRTTARLVQQFTAALSQKLAAAEKKYGYSNGWAAADWADECRAQLMEHIAKGDPLDVAAYCAFAWHHGWSTAEAPVTADLDGAKEFAKLYEPDDYEDAFKGRTDLAAAQVAVSAEPPRCPRCGYTNRDCRNQMDHHLCGLPTPPPACQTCSDSGWVGGPSYQEPGEGGKACPDCEAVPAVDEATRLFNAGWYACAELADRDDLPHDVGSPFYDKKLAAALKGDAS